MQRDDGVRDTVLCDCILLCFILLGEVYIDGDASMHDKTPQKTCALFRRDENLWASHNARHAAVARSASEKPRARDAASLAAHPKSVLPTLS